VREVETREKREARRQKIEQSSKTRDERWRGIDIEK
jgi:hypothetical protein